MFLALTLAGVTVGTGALIGWPIDENIRLALGLAAIGLVSWGFLLRWQRVASVKPSIAPQTLGKSPAPQRRNEE